MGHLALSVRTPTPTPLALGSQGPSTTTGLFAFANSTCVGALLFLAILAGALAYYASQKKKFAALTLWGGAAVAFVLPFVAAWLFNDACAAIPYAVGEGIVVLLLAALAWKNML